MSDFLSRDMKLIFSKSSLFSIASEITLTVIDVMVMSHFQEETETEEEASKTMVIVGSERFP